MKLESTSPSSSEREQRIKARLSLDDQTFLFTNDDELQRRRASDFARGARVREAHRAKVVEAVKAAADAIAAPLRVLPPEKHAEEIEAQIDVKPGHYGLRKTPSLKLIQSILDTEFLNQKI